MRLNHFSNENRIVNVLETYNGRPDLLTNFEGKCVIGMRMDGPIILGLLIRLGG
jgi:hypothetical protein